MCLQVFNPRARQIASDGSASNLKNQTLLVGDSSDEQARGKKKKGDKNIDSKLKENHKSFDGASGSKKKKKFWKSLCSYYMKGFHLEIY